MPIFPLESRPLVHRCTGSSVSIDLTWLPELAGRNELLAAARLQPAELAFASFQTLTLSRMDFVGAGRLDRAIQRFVSDTGAVPPWPRLRLGLLGSSNLAHLAAGIRLAALRRGLWVEIYEGSYGMYRQEIEDTNSSLHHFQPDVICLALDADHVAGGLSVEQTLASLQECWATARRSLGCAVIQQTVLPRLPRLLGSNEARYPSSPAFRVEQLNVELRHHAAADGICLLPVDTWAANEGLTTWHDPGLWYTAKQEVHPRAANLYGEYVARILAALRGLSRKCLVLDLDNTLWGGVIGDDGLDGIVLGQGTPAGEAYIALQRYAKQLAERGVILAVCSKNDEANALAAFDSHPDMVLRRSDIACFVANWQDKAHNLRSIASDLNIGLDALVFLDDNPVERALIRQELPAVWVPELPEDPAEYVSCLANTGAFEALELTDEDRERTTLYRANAQREDLRRSATDIRSFLEGLDMRLTWSSFDHAGRKRIVQLLNKTNQFNLTTLRCNEADVLRLMEDPDALTLQLRLTDIYGDNGVVGLVTGRRTTDQVLVLETWLMSCRVLGREVERATLDIIVAAAREMGCKSLHGIYRPTAKNAMVRGHYRQLGFAEAQADTDGITHWRLAVDTYLPSSCPIQVQKGSSWPTPTSIAS